MKSLKSGRGGARPGAGMPKGQKWKKTLDKEAAREALRQIVKENLAEMVAAQIENAKGLKYLIARNKKTGKFEKLTAEMAEKLLTLAPEEAQEVIEVWEKDPNVNAFTDLLNRTIDKPTEHVEMDANVTGTVDLVDRLMAGRKRVAESKRGDGK